MSIQKLKGKDLDLVAWQTFGFRRKRWFPFAWPKCWPFQESDTKMRKRIYVWLRFTHHSFVGGRIR